jgi:type IV pilus assembly protein PilY1
MHNKKRHRHSTLAGIACATGALALAVTTHVAQADDIDAYSNPPTAGGRPNVLFIFDNTANWSATLTSGGGKCMTLPERDASGAIIKEPVELLAANVSVADQSTKFGAEKCALYRLILSMTVDELSEFNLAFMFFNESPFSSGYPRQAFINVTTETEKQQLLARIAAWHILNDKGNNAATAESFYEAWLWFKGDTVHLGNKTVTKLDDEAFVNGSARTKYRSPGIGCAQNHIIYLANGSPQDNNVKSLELLKKLNPTATRIRIPIAEGVSNPDEANWADEFAAFFSRNADISAEFDGLQTIQVHGIAVTGASSDGNFPNYIRWMAQMGGGLYQEARNADTITTAVKDALNQIRASNSAFTSAALPASANTQGAYLNQVFIGMFRPDKNALPRWVGNMKQYQFKYDSVRNTLELADRNGNTAISNVTGFMNDNAVSFWTENSSFWINAQIASNNAYSKSDRPDGPLVEKGGVGQWLRTVYPTLDDRKNRRIYTCVNDCSDVDLAGEANAGRNDWLFIKDNSDLRNALSGATSNAENLIEWIRGEENVGLGNVRKVAVAKDQLTAPPLKNTSLNPPINVDHTVRPAIHGDVLHSRPVALNYAGTNQTPNIVVFYGANDGMLRAINGNQTGTSAGSELWAFVAPEHFKTLDRLRENDPEVRYPSTATSNETARKRDYYFDGPIGAYQNGSKVLIFPTMRRGGNAVYAFDASDPQRPRLLWRVNPALTDFAKLGQTWSTPRVALIKDRNDPVLIMGGGFDNLAEDATTPAASTTFGKGVYVLDMTTGLRVGYLDTEHSVPSDVTLLDTDGDGRVDRGYAVDVRANLYRIDMEDADGTARDPSRWTITKLANFNDTTGKRRVFFAPDAVRTKDYIALMLGTGDREKPLTLTTNDRFFIFKDRKVSKGEPTDVTVLTELDTTRVVPVGETAARTDPDACYVQMETDGEKVINQPVTFGGVTYFSTSKPASGGKTCSTIVSKAYQVPLICRAPVAVELVGDGLPPSPVVGFVEVKDASGNDVVVPFVIGGPNLKKSAIEVHRPNLSIPGSRKRTYWFMNNRDR